MVDRRGDRLAASRCLTAPDAPLRLPLVKGQLHAILAWTFCLLRVVSQVIPRGSVRRRMANDLLERYLRGECEAVWAEVTALRDLRDDVEMQLVAVAIAHETMQRVKVNIRTLAERLQRLGFRFGDGLFGDIADDERQILLGDAPVYGSSSGRQGLWQDEAVRLEDMTGGLPIALHMFYEVVGSVNLVGTGPMWKEYETDLQRPLAWHGLSRYGSDRLFVWSAKVALESYLGGFGAVVIAPNYDYKFGIGGGSGPYEVRVPCATADASLENEWHQTTCVDYLRICCRWGGFLGLEYHRDRDRLADVIHDLTHDLLPF